MIQYKEFAPTEFDHKGLHIYGDDEDDRGEWYVAPVGITRDTPEGSYSYSNFKVLEQELENKCGEEWENHRFGHWGPGWFEIILVKPNSRAFWICDETERALEDYPILDEEDHSCRQWDAAVEAWEWMQLDDRVKACSRFGCSIFAARREEIPSGGTGEIVGYLAEGC